MPTPLRSPSHEAADAARLDATFGALASPVRRTILSRLAEGEASVGELAEPLGISLPAVSRHIRVLEAAGLIEQGQRGRRRPCRLKPEALQEAESWVEQYRTIWEDRFDKMSEVLGDDPKST